MRHRIHSPGPFAPGDRIAIRGEELHHAARVVRVREGEEVEVFDADAEPTWQPGNMVISVTLFIGPEGGFSQAEMEAAVKHGAHIQRLGPRRLRAETAAIVACALMGVSYGDLR